MHDSSFNNVDISKIPIIGKKYYWFDDGKIRLSRRFEVIITDIISFSDIDKETLDIWKQEVEDYHWVYAKETDFFVKANIIDEDETIFFVRTVHIGWFSFGTSCGRLDIDGALNSSINGNPIRKI